VPLFGTVILGMLWRRATPAGGFWGFLIAILFSMGMWTYVHTFPHGYRPQPKATLSDGAAVTLDTTGEGKQQRVTRVAVESGTVSLVNVPVVLASGGPPVMSGEHVIGRERVTLPATPPDAGRAPMQILAPSVVLSATGETHKFGIEGAALELRPGVRVQAEEIAQRFAPAAFNPDHVRTLARSAKAKPMAVNMYSAWWSLVVCVFVTVFVSLFTRPKPDAELKDLVYGLTPLPDEGPCPWYQRPALWATVVGAILVGINVIFW
jgi:hypothetical protein